MNFIKICIILILSSVINISFFSAQSLAQVTWNTFEEKNGLFTIQIPSNWNASEIPATESLAPIDYMFIYDNKGNSFAWIELMISNASSSSPRDAADSYILDNQQLNNFTLLETTNCSTYVINHLPACSNLSSQQIKDEQRRNILSMVSVSPDGYQTDIVFIASNNIYDTFLPVADYMIKSISIDPTAVGRVLTNQSTDDFQSEIPPLPTQNTPALQSEIPIIPREDGSSQIQSNISSTPAQENDITQPQTFRSAFNTFVSSEPQEFGVYDEKASNTFNPGEDIILYIEPKGFEYGTATDGADEMLYTVDFTADFTISDTEGNLLTGQQGLPVDKIVLPYQEKKVFIPFIITQEEPFPPGKYIITYTIHDDNSGKSFDIVKEFVITQN